MLADPDTLRRDLVSSRQRSSAITRDLAGERLLGPMLAIVNPPLWEIGHVGWFQERWCLRWQPGGALKDAMLPGADALYDSARVAHGTRWNLPLPDIAATRAYQAQVLERVLARLEREPENAELAYFVRLATFHEDMHAEAFLYTRQTLGYADPFADFSFKRTEKSGDIEFTGGKFLLGAMPGGGFVFDNEKWAHAVEVAPFRMSPAPVTNAEYLAYVEAGGKAPRYWKRQHGQWLRRRFDQWLPIVADEAVLHVDCNEAEAFCSWTKRRLPTEAEWEFAAVSGKIPQTVGVWEWTASTFGPYAGFVVDPYEEYSEPWFGTHRVLRGGSFAAPARLLRETFRNFYTPDRGDIFAGLRSCALD